MTFRAYADLLRIQFAFAWPLLFCSGIVLAFATYQNFSWPLVITAPPSSGSSASRPGWCSTTMWTASATQKTSKGG